MQLLVPLNRRTLRTKISIKIELVREHFYRIQKCLWMMTIDIDVTIATQIQLDVKSDEFPFLSADVSTKSFVSVSSSAIGASATRAAVMLCLQCAVGVFVNNKISPSTLSMRGLFALIAGLSCVQV